MSLIRSFSSPQMVVLSDHAQRRAEGQVFALVLALLLTVLVVEAVAIATAAQSVSEIGWLYTSTT